MKSLQLYKMSALTVAPFLSCESVGMTKIDSHGELRPPSALPGHHLQFSFIRTIPSLYSPVQQSRPPIQWDVHSATGAQGAFASFSIGRVTNHAHLVFSGAAF